MKKINYIFQIVDELYARTHIPCIILNDKQEYIYPHFAPIDLLEMIDPNMLSFTKPSLIKLLIEDDCIAYASFAFSCEEKTYYLLSGCLLNQLTTETNTKLPSRWTNLVPEASIRYHIGSEVLTSFQNFIKMMYAAIHHEYISNEAITVGYLRSKKRNTDDNLTLRRIAQTTPEFYQWEQTFLKKFREGDLEQMNALLTQLHHYDINGIISDSIEDMKYKYVAFITLLTRNAIQNGAQHDPAFALSDQCLKKVKQVLTSEQLSLLFKESIAEFFTLTSAIKNTYSLHISKSIHFIDTHLYDKLSLKDVALHTELSDSYLSLLFKTEMKETITSYIQRKKIEEAQRLLLFTNKSLSEISSLLNFNSQSNFIQIFKKVNQMTPKQYQRTYCKDL